MSAPDPELPDDVDALKAMVVAMARQAASVEAHNKHLDAHNKHLDARNKHLDARNKHLDARNRHLEQLNKSADERIARLTAIVRMLERARFGNRSERLRAAALSEEQLALVFDEVETGVAAIEAQLEKTSGGERPKRAPRPRKSFAAHLERVEVVIEPLVPAGCEELEKVLIGEDVSERLDVTPAKFRVIVTRRPKYAYKGWDGVAQAAAPVHIIDSGIPTEALLAQIAVAKYADGLPLYRQEAIYARDKVDLDRSQMAQWMGKVGFEIEPLADRILERIKAGERVFADETTLPTLAPGTGKTKTAWLWTYVRDDRPFGGSGPPLVAYRFEDSRAGECVERHLQGYRGILQVDGYAGYNRVARSSRADASDRANEGATLAGCWSHLRRKFYELHVAGSSVIASQTVAQMAPLWAIEESVRGYPPAARVAARQEQSAPLVAALFELWQRELPKLSGKSKLAEAIRYGLTRRSAFERFLADGRIEIDSNTVERAIRPQTITRKNALFAGSDGGGRTWATIATLLATARMNNVDPHAWLTQTLQRLAAGWPNSQIDTLMPWNFAAQTASA